MIHRERDQFQINLEREVLGRIREITKDSSPDNLKKEELRTVGVEEALRELLTILSNTSGGKS